MPVSVLCSACGSKFKAPDKAAGRNTKCPKCGAAIIVPGADTLVSEHSHSEPSDKARNRSNPTPSRPKPTAAIINEVVAETSPSAHRSVQWFCRIDNTKYGPLSFKDLVRMAEAGKLTAKDLVKQSSDTEWIPAGTIQALPFIFVKGTDHEADGYSHQVKEQRLRLFPAVITFPLAALFGFLVVASLIFLGIFSPSDDQSSQTISLPHQSTMLFESSTTSIVLPTFSLLCFLLAAPLASGIVGVVLCLRFVHFPKDWSKPRWLLIGLSVWILCLGAWFAVENSLLRSALVQHRLRQIKQRLQPQAGLGWQMNGETKILTGNDDGQPYLFAEFKNVYGDKAIFNASCNPGISLFFIPLKQAEVKTIMVRVRN